MAERNSFELALREARVAEAAVLEASLNIRDARALRLESLRDAVKVKLSGHVQAQALFDLTVQPGAKPKLWIDLVSAVVMEPDPRSYRLVQDRENSRETVFETTQEAEMVSYLTRYLAHRVVVHDKAVTATSASFEKSKAGYSLLDMIYVWATGCLFGVLALITLAMYLGRLHF